jgi:hypothetical protein
MGRRRTVTPVTCYLRNWISGLKTVAESETTAKRLAENGSRMEAANIRAGETEITISPID